jgi:type IV pilus assembly protein PilM
MKAKKIGSRIVSIEVDELNIRILYGKKQKVGIKVIDSFVLKTPTGAVKDGQIIKLMELESTIRLELEARRIKKCLMSFSFKSSSYQEREIILPKLSDKELPAMVEYEIQQYLPFDVSKFAIQFKRNSEFLRDGQEFVSLNVTAIEKSIIKPYMSLVKKLGFKHYKFDLSTNSLIKLIAHSKLSDKMNIGNKQVAVIEFGHYSSNVSIFKDGSHTLTQSVEFGNKDVINALEKIEGYNDKAWSTNFIKDYDFSKINPAYVSEILEDQLVNRVLDRGVNDILSVFRYYMSRDEYNKIDEVLLYGNLSELKGIEKNLVSQFMVPISKLEKKHFDDLSEGLDFFNQIHNVGSIIYVPEIADYNFFEAFEKKSSTNYFYVFGVVLAVTAVILGYTLYDYKISSLNDEYNELNSELGKLLSKGHVEEVKSLEDSLEKMLSNFEDLIVYQATDQIFNVVKRENFELVRLSVPELLYFENWIIDYKYTTITGVTYDLSLLAEFENNLRDIGISEVKSQYIIEDLNTDDKYYFEIQFSNQPSLIDTVQESGENNE